jgi:hypothetical protein
MNDNTDELNNTGEEENVAYACTDEQLEAAADPTKPLLWTLPTAMGSTACCQSGPSDH